MEKILHENTRIGNEAVQQQILWSEVKLKLKILESQSSWLTCESTCTCRTVVHSKAGVGTAQCETSSEITKHQSLFYSAWKDFMQNTEQPAGV